MEDKKDYIDFLRASIKQNKTESLSSNVKTLSCKNEVAPLHNGSMEPLLITGVSGCFPGCESVSQFWEAIDQDKSLITEIPEDRFNWKDYYAPTSSEANKMVTKWGGFIPDIASFDPDFFQISPAEAEEMDPRQRLLLMSTWHTLEDAGIAPLSLKGSNTGIFIGCEANEYFQLMQGYGITPAFYHNHADSMLANRISYYFDWSGPSEVVNTMCSGFAVALHRAVVALRAGTIERAIVGAANLLLNPDVFVALSQADQLSKEKTVQSFGKDAGGYIRSEGIGTILLERMDDAKDQNAYLSVKHAAINYNGQNGFSIASPNVAAHTSLIKECYHKAGIDVRKLGYIEAQGMGLAVSDITEWNAMNQALREVSKENGYNLAAGSCRVSTLKPLSGHMHAASSFGALVKIIRSLQTNRIHKVLGFEASNEYCEMEGTPCRIVKETEAWEPGESPRMAAFHSFGSGGNNAHVVLEECVQETSAYIGENPAIILLSAKNEARLQELANRLLVWLQDHSEVPLHGLAYTLQMGREAMESRLAFVVNDLEELKTHLASYQKGDRKNLFTGNIKKDSDFVLKKAAGEDYLREAIAHEESERLAQRWIKGVEIDWNLLYEEGSRPGKIHLPTYPFAKERCWIQELQGKRPLDTPGDLHPLLHCNNSNLQEQKFSSVYSGKEYFLSDHKVAGKKVFPGVAYLELAREAGRRSLEQEITQFKDITWLRPIQVSGRAPSIQIGVFKDGEEVGYEVYSESEGEETIHSQGKLSTKKHPSPQVVDITAIQNRLKAQKESKECYELFKALGMDYGSTFQGIKTLYYSDEEALARLVLPKEERYVLQPGILDSALQSCIGLHLSEDEYSAAVPFSVKEVMLYGDVGKAIWSYVCKSKTRYGDKIIKYDIDLLSETGEVLLSFREFVALPLEGFQHKTHEMPQLHYYTTSWEEKEITVSLNTDPSTLIILLAGGSVFLAEALTDRLACEVIAIDAHTEIGFYTKVQAFVQAQLVPGSPSRLMVIYPYKDVLDYGFISGLLKTARLESSRFSGKTMGIESLSLKELDWLVSIVEEEQKDQSREVRYRLGRREVKKLSPLVLTSQSDLPIKEGGVYLITGGCGGLGQRFAEHLSKTEDTKLILSGRRKQSPLSKEELEALNAMYCTCDVTDSQAVENLIQRIIDTHGQLDGIIHSAGVVRDNFLINKTQEEAEVVLAPKIAGVKYLDHATKSLDLDFMVYCSSVAGVTGNPGQGDYAAANAFMDGYADFRNTLLAKGERKGHTISMNWPFWKEGGIVIDEESEKYQEKTWGMHALPTKEGLNAFEALLQQECTQGMVVYGLPSKIQSKVSGNQLEEKSRSDILDLSEALQEKLKAAATKYFRSVFSSVFKLPEKRIKPTEPFENYGIDSILITKLVNTLNEVFEDLPVTLFFEYQNLEEVIAYFMLEHPSRLLEVTGIQKGENSEVSDHLPVLPPEIYASRRKRFSTSLGQDRFPPHASTPEPIAIVGLSGRYPGSRDLNEFWQNLKDGKDCITEIPEDRWSLEGFYDAEPGKAGKSYSKWGGFIDDVDKFDPLFFNISPREAEQMDPQERLFLQTVWEALEDGGYTRSTLRKAASSSSIEGAVGVYAGVMYEEYQLYGVEENLKGNPLTLFNSPSSIANRVSYVLNLHGPSMAVDTMCSSSLTAIHLAIEAIHHGQCRMAIAGGINVSIHPNKYKILSQGRFVSEKGRCESFGMGGNGFVPAEGVGVVLLKRLSQAQSDRDQIYGVIKGSSLNHGGKTNGYTVPNPKAQAEVIKQTIERAGVQPQDISYIEAHGTGTSLGDPVEIAGLSKAFQSSDKKGQYCSIGSLKSNIGHAESAAGIGGVTKVLLQLKHRQLVPSLHSSTLNPNIDFGKTPFRVQQELAEWTAADNTPRLAGVSSFGAGGSNAHLIIEEYQKVLEVKNEKSKIEGPFIIPLSARNEERLQAVVQNLVNYLDTHSSVNHEELQNIAYTLQIGRESMEARLALVVEEPNELVEQLVNYQQGQNEGCYTGNIKKDRNDFVLKGKAGEAYLREAIANKEGESLAQLWVKGVEIDWHMFYDTNHLPNKISLPTYPFSRERYWIPKSEKTELLVGIQNQPHPLSQYTNSNLHEDQAKLNEGKDLSDEIVMFQPEWMAATGKEQSRSKNLARCLVFLGEPTKPLWQELQNSEAIELLWIAEKPSLACVVELYSLIKKYKTKEFPTQIILIHDNSDWERYSYLSGLFRTLQLSDTPLSGKLVGIDSAFWDSTTLLHTISLEGEQKEVEVRYVKEDRQVKGFSPLSAKKESAQAIEIKAGGVYLISGGAGGIGLSIARHLSISNDRVRTVLLGRSPLNKEIEKKISSIANAVYYSCDVSNKSALEALLTTIRATYGKIDGVIHAAGNIGGEDYSVFDLEDIAKSEVLVPKIAGCENLDELTQMDALDFMICFSSISGTLEGVIGLNHSDYAIANAYLNQFAYKRNQAVEKGDRQGYTISINWPVWQVGMYNEKSDQWMEEFWGLASLSKEAGVSAFQQVLENPTEQVLVLYGQRTKLLHLFNSKTEEKQAFPKAQIPERSPKAEKSTREAMLDIFSNIFGFKKSEPILDHSFEELGANSVMLMQLRNELEKQFNIQIHIPELIDTRNLGELLTYLESELQLEQQEIQVPVSDQQLGSFSLTPLDSEVISHTNAKIPNTVFVLSSTRSGSTLFRVMLTSHSKIFAPTELHLLNYSSMGGRALDLQGGQKMLKEGLLKAFSTLYDNDIEFAQKKILEWEKKDVPIAHVYKELHKKLSGEILVDKTPMYGMEYSTLSRAEAIFDAPIYIHLHRHPLASMGSFVRNRFHKIVNSTLLPWTIAENDWAQTNGNIQRFLQTIPECRKLRIAYEDLVVHPQVILKRVCKLLNIDFEERMCFPYENLSEKMTGGLYQDSIMIGDPNFLKHTKIDPTLAEGWKPYTDHWKNLDKKTRDLAASLNYDIDEEEKTFSVEREKKPAQDLKSSSMDELLGENFDGSTANGKAKQELICTDAIAIIGVSGRFTGSEDIKSLWKQSVLEGKSAFTSKDTHELSSRGNLINFDRVGLTGHDYKTMGRQQQLVFEMLSHAMENGKITKEQLKGSRTAVFIAAAQLPLPLNDRFSRSAFKAQDHMVHLLAAKVSFHLDLQGPSEVFNVSCASTYVAIDRAVQSLRDGDCDQAIIGAVNIITPETSQYGAASDLSSLLSRTGVMKSFDNTADGIVPSEGVGVIFLKKMALAESARNKIYGLIKGTSFANGGKNLAWESPNPRGLKTVILNSIQKSKVDVDTIDYVEAHGIANPIADSIELSAISKTYKKLSKYTDKKWYVGSVKPVIGHPGLASGMASLIKVLKAFEHKTIPGIVGLGEITQELASDHSLILPTTATPWKNDTYPRRAALNSYAVGGANAHIILEEYQGNTSFTAPPELIETKTEETPEIESPINPTERLRDQLLSMAAITFEIDQETIDPKASPIDYDFDSVKVIRFIRRVNEHFGIEVKIGQILSADDFESMFSLFEEAVIESNTAACHSPEVLEEGLPTYYPLSEGQKGLYFIQLSESSSFTYNVPISLEVNGEVDPEKVYQLTESLLETHPVLRTSFTMNSRGEPVQEIQKVSGYLRRDIKELEKNETFPAAFKPLRVVPFDLSKEVFRLHIRINKHEQKTGLLFLIHHIVMDGTSAMIFLSKFSKLLQQQQKGMDLIPFSLERNYFDFISSEQRYLQSKEKAEDLAYWKNKLHGNVEEPLALPYDFISKEEEGSTTGMEQIEWSGEELKHIKATAKSLRVNLSVLLLSIFKVLLYRLTSMENITVTIPTAGRSKEQYDASIGFYINSMLSFDCISAEESFLALVERVHSGFTKDIDHVRYPYPKLLTELKLTRGDSDERFPVSFAYQNIFDRALDEKAVDDITLVETIEQEVTSAYTLSVMDLRDRITVKLKYRKDRFLRESIQQHLGYYRRILKAIIGEPRTIIREIALLSEKEKHQLLFEFNDTKAAYPKDKTLVELFEEQVKQTPEHIALVFEEKQWTYEQLNQTANQLGNYLKRSYRIQPDDRIGIQLERGTCLVISILGILKSGGAYVPIDLEYPQDRIDHMIQDSDCKVVMDQKELDKFQMVQQNYSKENLPVLSRPHHLAYVIYTSGSTGKPKGVMVEHRNLSNYIHYANNKYYFDNHANDNNCVLYSSLSFDLTVTSLYLPFLSGSTLHIIDQQDTNQLLKNVLTTEANLIKLTPAHIDLLDGSDLSINTSIGCVIVGGEQFTSSQLKKMRALKADLKIFNEYGPTEATVGCSVFELLPETNSISIGAPISNTQMHVIDANMQLVPIGVSGELCIAGDGLARGYLNCPELTAEKFVKNPFGKGRLYKTGDLARRLHNGNIEFLGRMDHQVKIRGYRIELGEIEAALNSYETIRNAVVIAREYEESKQLVAYYVPKNEGEELEVPKLKSYVSKSLPEYMVPSFLVPINEIPLTPNGKTDRKALIARKLKITGNLEYVAPGTETEKQLTVIWQEVLGVEQVGIHDNFFELGGHSLNVTRLMNRIHSQLLVETNIKELFLHPILADQATLIEKHSLSKYQSIPRAPAQASYPLSNAQRRLWVLSQFEEGNKAYNVPLVYHVQGVLDLDALTEAFKDMMKRHEILRTVFRADAEEEVRQWVLEMEALEFSIAFEDLSKEQVSPLSLKETLVRTVSAPFNLEKSPLLRVNLFKLSQDRYVFVCVMHHIISDEWSMDIFIRELFTIYQGRISGEETLLPALPIQYKDYSLWQQDQLESGILEASRVYWLSRFKGEVPVLSLPTDHVRPRVKTYRGGLVVGKIPMEVLSSLESLLQKQGATLFMGVTALVKVLLYRYSGQEDLIVGSPVTGRDHQDLSGQIGFYLNTLALRTHIDANKGFISLLKQLKETTLAAYEHQRYPFDKLVDELDLRRDRSRSALFDVMVILANAEGLRDQKVSVGVEGLQLNHYPFTDMDEIATKFDLSFHFTPTTEGLHLNLAYNRDLYEKGTAERMLGHVVNFAARIVKAPEVSIGELEYFSKKERHDLLLGFNDTEVAYPKDKTLVKLFEVQAKKTPNTIAVVFEETEITYKELEKRSRQLAVYLQHQGVRSNTLIGICMDRSIEMIVAILGTLRAGGAYVPMDPYYPRERVTYMIEDSLMNGNATHSAKILLTQHHLKVKLEAIVKDQEVAMISLAPQWDDNREILNTKGRLQRKVSADSLAYVIYTSGSTGKPKGVMVEHSAIYNRISWMQEAYGLTPQDHILQKTPFSFDVSVWEFLWPVSYGARLVFALPDKHKDPTYILDTIKSKEITWIHFVPSMLKEFLLLEDLSKDFCSLHGVVCSGEALEVNTKNLFLDKLKNVCLYNLYGPTEAAIDVTHWPCELTSPIVPIGKPISNTQLYILGKNSNELLPLGIPGQLCIAGAGLARGYLNRPNLTAEKFVANPFGEGKLYLTGDLARWLPDGNIEFLGRMDHQVKIRGYRIELGEIETTLNSHKMIQNAVVIAKEHAGNKQLVAYYIPKNRDEDLEAQELKNYLSESLPEHMIPAFFMPITEIPLTSNGKTDRKALIAKKLEIRTTYDDATPVTEIEKQLATIWQEILQLDSLGLYDNFFDLGGNSLLSIKLINRMNTHLTHLPRLQVSKLYDYPTVKELAAHIQSLRNTPQINKVQDVLEKTTVLPKRIPQGSKLFEPESVKGSLAQDTGMVFDYYVPLATHAFFKDHEVFGYPVMPIGGYVEIIHTALRTYLGIQQFELQDIYTDDPLVGLEEEIYFLQLTLQKHADQRIRFIVNGGLIGEREEEQMYMRGFIQLLEPSKKQLKVQPDLVLDNPIKLSNKEFSTYIPSITSKEMHKEAIHSLELGLGMAKGIIDISPGRMQVMTRLLNGALTCAVNYCAHEFVQKTGSPLNKEITYLPYSLKNLTIQSVPRPERYTCLISIEELLKESMVVTFSLTNASGEVVLQAQALQLIPVTVD